MSSMTETTHTEPTLPLPPFTAESYPGYAYAAPTDPWLPPTPPTGPDRTSGPEKPRRGVVALIAVALAAGLVGGGAGAAFTSALDDSPATVNSLNQSAGTSADTAAAPTGSVEQVAAKVLPSVVSISVRTASGGGTGTGVVISSDGLILTNNHVVAEAEQGATMEVSFNDGRTAAATLVGRDPVTDLAVIRATGVSDLKPATLGDSSVLKPGQSVVAIGSPLGLQGTVTSGIVSALNRPVRTGESNPTGESQSTVIDAIQTDAAINPGNSGGPLVNMRGEVVGINSAIASLGSSGGQSGSIGLGFSIPIDQARRVADQLTKSGSAVHAQLGVSVSDIADGSAQGGAGIAAVTPGGGAAKAGLEVGDVVTKVGDREVDGADALIAAVRSHQPGDKVTLTYTRGGGDSRTATVTLGSDA
jgi:putative serine protease PepD